MMSVESRVPAWGLTGGIGAGKSVAAGILRGLGLPVIDMDAVATTLMMPGKVVHRLVAEKFGPAVLAEDGTINRKALAEVVFNDADKLARLESIVHPPVIHETRRRIENQAVARASAVFVESAIIFEAGLDRWLAGTVMVDAPAEARIARVVQRDGCTEDAVRQRIAAQMADDVKAAKAFAIWDNSGSPECLRRQIVQFLGELRV